MQATRSKKECELSCQKRIFKGNLTASGYNMIQHLTAQNSIRGATISNIAIDDCAISFFVQGCPTLHAKKDFTLRTEPMKNIEESAVKGLLVITGLSEAEFNISWCLKRLD